MSNVRSYDPTDITIIISSNGLFSTPHIVGGLKKDNPVTVEIPNETSTEEDLHDGTVVRSRNVSKMYTTTLRLDQTSQSNDVFFALHEYDANNFSSQKGLFTCSFLDKSGRTYITSVECFLKAPQSNDYNQQSSVREWKIVFVGGEKKFGGTGLLDPNVVKLLEELGVNVDEKWKLVK